MSHYLEEGHQNGINAHHAVTNSGIIPPSNNISHKAPSTSNSKPKRKRDGLRKAPGAPKRFKSSYIMFFMAKQDEIKSELGKGASVGQISKRSSEKWKALSLEDRAIWDEKAKIDKERYNLEKEKYTGPWQVPYTRPKKDPNAPKRPMSAFLYFSQVKRRSIREANPGVRNTEISRVLGDLWKKSSTEERAPHIEKEAIERRKYKIDIAKWREEDAVRKARAALEVEQQGEYNGEHDQRNGSGHMMINEGLLQSKRSVDEEPTPISLWRKSPSSPMTHNYLPPPPLTQQPHSHSQPQIIHQPSHHAQPHSHSHSHSQQQSYYQQNAAGGAYGEYFHPPPHNYAHPTHYDTYSTYHQPHHHQQSHQSYYNNYHAPAPAPAPVTSAQEYQQQHHHNHKINDYSSTISRSGSGEDSTSRYASNNFASAPPPLQQPQQHQQQSQSQQPVPATSRGYSNYQSYHDIAPTPEYQYSHSHDASAQQAGSVGVYPPANTYPPAS